MSFLSAREHGAKPGSGGVASAQQEVRYLIIYYNMLHVTHSGSLRRCKAHLRLCCG